MHSRQHIDANNCPNIFSIEYDSLAFCMSNVHFKNRNYTMVNLAFVKMPILPQSTSDINIKKMMTIMINVMIIMIIEVPPDEKSPFCH